MLNVILFCEDLNNNTTSSVEIAQKTAADIVNQNSQQQTSNTLNQIKPSSMINSMKNITHDVNSASKNFSDNSMTAGSRMKSLTHQYVNTPKHSISNVSAKNPVGSFSKI